MSTPGVYESSQARDGIQAAAMTKQQCQILDPAPQEELLRVAFFFFFFFSFFFVVFLGPHLQHMEVLRLGVELEM